MQATQRELDYTKAALERDGYEVTQRADQFGDNPYLVVQDPVRCFAGRLVLMDYEPVIIRSYGAARRFMSERS